MTLPKPRNVLLGFLIGALVVVAALVIAQDQETLRVRTSLAAADQRFPEYLARLLGTPLTMGDAYVVHTDGPQAFAAMLGAVDREDMDADNIERLERAGVRIAWFNKVSGYSLEELNYRTHRKSLIVDGTVAFVGGIGISDQWAMNLPDDPMWRDTQVELRGSAPVNVEASFNENWIEGGGEVEPDLLPHEDGPAGQAQSIVVWASPEGGANRMKLLYLLSIAAARKTIDIESPYVVLDESTQWSLTEARRRGVRVRILMEGDITDAKPVKFAGRANYERLLEHGIELYEYQPAMMHAKLIVVDGALSIVGSANFDNRSLELNDELNIAVFDPALASRLLTDFDRDLTRSQRIQLDEWRSRPLHIRGREKLWSFFGEVF